MVQAPSLAEFTALQQALEQARLDQKQAEQAVQALRGELRMAQAERDLLQERLNQFKRQPQFERLTQARSYQYPCAQVENPL